jgi:hypothetical protein
LRLGGLQSRGDKEIVTPSAGRLPWSRTVNLSTRC